MKVFSTRICSCKGGPNPTINPAKFQPISASFSPSHRGETRRNRLKFRRIYSRIGSPFAGAGPSAKNLSCKNTKKKKQRNEHTRLKVSLFQFISSYSPEIRGLILYFVLNPLVGTIIADLNAAVFRLTFAWDPQKYEMLWWYVFWSPLVGKGKGFFAPSSTTHARASSVLVPRLQRFNLLHNHPRATRALLPWCWFATNLRLKARKVTTEELRIAEVWTMFASV